MSKPIRPAFKCHGGKFYLSSWIISHFPEDYVKYTYVEPFCGGANVLINKQKSDVETIADIDLSVVQIFRALRDEPTEFIHRLTHIKYKEETFLKAVARSKNTFDDYLDHAVNEFILRRMSRGGLRKNFAWSNRLRGGQPGDINAWKTAIKNLPTISERLKGVYILNRPAIDVLKGFNRKDTLIYADPPYLHETRNSPDAYEAEMTAEDHFELGKALNNFSGKVIISGYSSPLYNRLFNNWNQYKKKVANHSSQQKSKELKTECLWKNF
jgi:DNA adenine methylase